VRRARRDAGFTLVEVMISIVIVGIIAGVVATTYAVLARSTRETQDRLDQSRGPKFASAYWTPDVASSEAVNPAGVRCGTTGTPLVTFLWTDDRQSDAQVATWAQVVSAGSTALVRMQCGAASLTTPARSTVVAPDVTTAQVRCDTGGWLAACTSPMTPLRVVLDVTTRDGRPFTIDANRQVS
jgi:prepilin-type N-terminal cleavage/methylation domain-containing protein